MQALHLLLERKGIKMNKSQSKAYEEAGVDIKAGYEAVKLMKKHLEKTKRPEVLSSIGGFGGLFQLGNKYKDPVLVSGTDGVGTKLKLAFMMDKHNTIGQDAVAMCVNDIICSGAAPLFFLDYIACGKNDPVKIASIVEGVAQGCLLSDCSLIGGETAEMPGFYPEDEYDLAGFAVGVVEKSKILDIENVEEGDLLLALPSSGLHSNGFSLVRKILSDKNLSLDQPFGSSSLGRVLLEPTNIYVKPVLALLEKIEIKALSHITGGGFYENIPRSLPQGLSAQIDPKLLRIPEIFHFIQEEGNISDHDMFNTFNMGCGMVIILSEKDLNKARDILSGLDWDSFVIGKVVKSDSGVIL